MQKVIEVHNGVARNPLFRFRTPIDFEVNAGEHIAIVGPNGGGKSMLIDILTGAHPLQPMNDVKYDFRPSKAKMVSDNIKYMTFRDSYGTTDGTYYYQQRWNQNDIDETPLVKDLLDESFQIAETGLIRKTNFDKFLFATRVPRKKQPVWHKRMQTARLCMKNWRKFVVASMRCSISNCLRTNMS